MSNTSTRTDTDEATALPNPEPLIGPNEEAAPYPLDALSPTIREAVRAYQHFGQQPVSLVATSSLCVAALAAQGLANVARDSNLTGPISLNAMIIAESGERKTSADNRMVRPARQWQEEYRAAHVADVARSQGHMEAWEAERDGILFKIKQAAASVDSAEVPTLKDLLTELDAKKPVPVIMPSLFYEDATPEALAQELALGWPSAALWSNEGALAVGSRGMSDESALRYFALLNCCWDGGEFTRARTTAKSFTVRNRRLTCSLMMQPAILTRLLSTAGGTARSVGFAARFLMTWPKSTMGTRLYRKGQLDDKALTDWDTRIKGLMFEKLPADPKTMELNPPLIGLSSEAHAIWVRFHDRCETELCRVGDFGDVADFAAKAAENAARIAAVMTVLEHGPTEINAAMMEAATTIMGWHLHETKRILGATEVPQQLDDAMRLEEWMRKPASDGRSREIITPRDVQREGPSPLRERKRRDAAADLLRQHKRLIDLTERTGLRWMLNPKLRTAHG